MKWTAIQVMYNKDAQKEFADLYYYKLGKRVSCNTCPAILNKSYFELKNALSLGENFTTMNTSQFILKQGVLISYNGSVYSETFLPENVAIELLAKHPAKFKHKFKSINQDMIDAYIANGMQHEKKAKKEGEAPVEKVEVIEAVVNEVEGEIVTQQPKPKAKPGRKAKSK